MKKIKGTGEIAAWKLDSPIERWLAKCADKSALGKKLYVQLYKIFDKEYYNKGLGFIEKNIKTFVGDISEEQKKEYIIDMVYSLHRFGCPFDEYFLFGYPTLNVKGREEFITDKRRWEYYAKMNTEENKEIFNDKRKAYDTFGKYYKRELIEVQSDEDEEKFLDFLSRNSRFIVKPYNGSGGRGIFVADSADYSDSKAMFAMLREKGHVVIEQLIRPAAEMAVFNASSVNTVRVPTLRLKDRVVVFEPFLRTGLGNAVVDNAASGGAFAPIDPETGMCTMAAVDEFGRKYLKHPKSGVVYPGFQIPKWKEAVAFVTELSEVLPDNHYVGWDIALTEDGWVMVEGNPRGQLVSQYATKKGCRKLLESYMSRM
ncbi:MAG: hypothetical protein IKJ60_07650 [Ruminococcus sp.]|nr:hypothetical protein [Ruminococcus sp.]